MINPKDKYFCQTYQTKLQVVRVTLFTFNKNTQLRSQESLNLNSQIWLHQEAIIDFDYGM